MTRPHKKRSHAFAKLVVLFLLLTVGGLTFLAMQDAPPPTTTITKTITPPAQQ